jgi:hypothetical protein
MKDESNHTNRTKITKVPQEYSILSQSSSMTFEGQKIQNKMESQLYLHFETMLPKSEYNYFKKS